LVTTTSRAVAPVKVPTTSSVIEPSASASGSADAVASETRT
jgi:hypothetical protein